MGQIVYCPKCDNVTSVKEKCKFCGGKGIVFKGKNGYSKIKK